jgi:hypothetical protein
VLGREVFKYVAEDRSYICDVLELSFDINTDRDAVWWNFYNVGKDTIWRHFNKAERLKFNDLVMLKMSVPP